MTILGHDPFLKGENEVPGFIEMVGLTELLARSCTSFRCTFRSQLKRKVLINRDRIAQMRPGAILVNTARGACNRKPRRAGRRAGKRTVGCSWAYRFFLTEPPDVSHQIFRRSRLICAPHLLGVSELAMERIYQSDGNRHGCGAQGKTPGVLCQ